MTAPVFIYTSEPWAAHSFGRPIFAPAFKRKRMSAGHLPQSSAASRFTASASEFFIFVGRAAGAVGEVFALRYDAFEPELARVAKHERRPVHRCPR